MSTLSTLRKRKVAASVAALGAAALVLAGCTPTGGSSDAGTATESAAPAPGGAFEFPINCDEASPAEYTPEYITTSGPSADPLTYKIGTLLPVTGSLAFLGPPEIAASDYAAEVVNEANKGITIEMVQGNSGDTTDKAYETEVTRVLNEGATAVVGAASSGVSLQFIDQVIAAGAVQISPANTSAAFTGYEDNGLYWRTAPSDVLQGEILGNLLANDGAETVGMIIINDAYGTGLACFTKTALEAAGGEVVAAQLFNDGDANFTSQIDAVLAADPDAIALITFDQAKVIVPEITEKGFDKTKLYFVDGNLANYSADLAEGALTGAKGTYPAVDPASIETFRADLQAFETGRGKPELTEFTYGPESFDAVILLALAALQAGATDGASVAANLQSVSGGVPGGTKCFSFAECADIILAGGQADYDGVSGPITFNEVGDPTEATIGIFEYEDNNNYVFKNIG